MEATVAEVTMVVEEEEVAVSLVVLVDTDREAGAAHRDATNAS